MTNIEVLIEKLSAAGSLKQQEHLSAMISLAKFIMDSGPIVATQKLAKKYIEMKGLTESGRIESSRLLDMMSKHLNVAQIYIEGRGYIVENNGIGDVLKLMNSVQNIGKMDQTIVNEKVKQVVGGDYDIILQYLDSKRDRDTLKAILTKLTSANFMANVANVQDRRSFQRAKDQVTLNLQLFEEMRTTVEETEESKLTGEAKRRKKYRMLQKMKLERLRHVFKGRGRHLKCEEFPDLAGILEFAFGEEDRVARAGGGLESHPRLIDTVLYRAADSNTIMRHARETILALAPEGFNISLSSWFKECLPFTSQAPAYWSRAVRCKFTLVHPKRKSYNGLRSFASQKHHGRLERRKS